MYRSFFWQKEDLVVEDASSWVFENTGLRRGERLRGLLGYEAGQLGRHAAAGTQRIAHSPYRNFKGESLYADMVFYPWASGATVVATGSMQWNWGLDDFNTFGAHPKWTKAAVQQATRNILNSILAATKSAHRHEPGRGPA